MSEIEEDSIIIGEEETIDDVLYNVEYLEKTKDTYLNETTNKKYIDLQTAIDEASNGDSLKLLTNALVYSVVEIPQGKNLTINLNHNNIKITKKFTNDGKLAIIDDSEENIGKLYTNQSQKLIVNNGTLNIKNVSLENNNTMYFIITNSSTGTINIQSSFMTGMEGIQNDGNMTLKNVNITSDNYSVYNNNQNNNEVSIVGGVYKNTKNNISVYNNGLSTSTMTLSGITENGIISNNNAILNIDNSELSGNYDSFGDYSVINNSNGVLNVNLSDVTISSTFDEYDRYSRPSNINCIYNNSGDLSVKSSNLNANAVQSQYNQLSTGIKIDSKTTDDNTILIDDVTTNISSKQQGASVYITGGANSSDIQIKNAKFNVNEAVTGYGIYETSTSNDFNVNLISGNIYTNATTAYGVYVDSGSLTMGIKDGDGSENATVDKENPFVKAVGTTGIGVKKNNGYFKYYDGKIMGSTNAKPDTTTDTEYNYESVMHTDQETGYEYCVLEYMK